MEKQIQGSEKQDLTIDALRVDRGRADMNTHDSYDVGDFSHWPWQL